jgi:predicted nuclease with TOPRIM domain
MMEEYNRLKEENELLKATVDRLVAEKEEVLELAKRFSDKNEALKAEFDSMETEFARMRAQLDIVYLIFGGK